MEEGNDQHDLFQRYDAILKSRDAEQDPQKKELYQFMQTSIFEDNFSMGDETAFLKAISTKNLKMVQGSFLFLQNPVDSTQIKCAAQLLENGGILGYAINHGTFEIVEHISTYLEQKQKKVVNSASAFQILKAYESNQGQLLKVL